MMIWLKSILWWILIFAVIISGLVQADNGSNCLLPLGMGKGHIKDEDISASSAFDLKSVGPHLARLDMDLNGGAWCPKKVIEPGVREWIEIDLQRPYRISRTATQGRYGGGQGQEYAEEFLLEYWRPSLKEWKTYRNHSGHSIMPGNSNTYVANMNDLSPPIVASKVRFVPHSTHKRTVCMRVEVYGCLYEDGIVSYSAPPGDEFAPNFFIEDVYDGDEQVDEKHGPKLINGLGVLSDGFYGSNVTLLESGLSSAHGWVGWNNKNRPSTITFEFSQRQEFQSVTLTTYCQLDLGIQAFSQMLAYFSADGLTYHPQYVKVVNKEPLVSYKSQNITLSLAKRIGRFVKLELYFDNKWLLISEVNFKSQSTGKDMDFIDAAAAAGTNSNASNHIKTENQQKSEQDRNDPAQVLSDTPEHHSGGSSENGATLNTNAKSNLTAKETNQMYIGLVIGILGVTVVLLVVTIVVMMRRNKQKIFNKNSMMFKSPLSDRHMMRDISNHGQASVTSKLYDESEHEESNSIYHEPYRLVLQRGGAHRNNSCGRLCDREYEDLSGLLIEQKNKFGSTPLFNIPPAPPVTSATTRPKLGPPPPTSFSCHEVKNSGYAIPNGVVVQPENFYAATDIVLKPETSKKPPTSPSTQRRRQQQQQLPQQQLQQQQPWQQQQQPFHRASNNNGGELFTTLHIPVNSELDELCTSLPNVPEFPRHQLRLLEKLGEGAFGMVHLCEASTDNLVDNGTVQSFHSGSSSSNAAFGRKTVVVKSLWKSATQQKRNAFISTVRRLSLLRDSNIAHVVAACTQDEPLCVLSEFTEYGDLCQFLRSHQQPPQQHYSNANDLNTSLSSSGGGSSGGSPTGLNTSTLVYIATQIASGMKYLENQGFVHRDLAARNCLVGASYHIKISDCAMFRPIYKNDYIRDQDNDHDVLPLRWIPWEVYIMRLWSSRSDVWSFGVTLWEIFSYCQEPPLADLTDEQIVENLKHWFHSDGFHLTPSRPSMHQCTKEMFDLIKQCWSREPEERPLFVEIHQFLQNKCLGFTAD